MAEPVVMKFDVDDKGRIKVDRITGSLDRMDHAMARTEKSGGQFFKTLAVGTIAAGSFAYAANRVASTMIQLMNRANEAEKSERKFLAVFKELSKESSAWADSFASDLGRSKYDVQKYLADIQDMLVPLGMSRRLGMELGQSLIARATDISAVNPGGTGDVIRDFLSGMVGNTEGLRKYGIIITEARVQQEAMAQGVAVLGQELSELEKVQMRANLIIKGSSDMAGMAANNLDSYSERVERLEALWKDFSIDIGKDFILLGSEIVDSLIDSLKNEDSRNKLRIAVMDITSEMVSGASKALQAAAPFLDLGLNIVNSTIDALNALPEDVRSWGLLGVALFGRSMSGLLLTHPAGIAAAAAAAIGAPLGKALGTPDYDKQIADRQRKVDYYRDQIRKSVDINYLRDTEDMYSNLSSKMKMGGTVEDYLLKAPKDLLDGLKEAKKALDSAMYEKAQFIEISEKIASVEGPIKPFQTFADKLEDAVEKYQTSMGKARADLLRPDEIPVYGPAFPGEAELARMEALAAASARVQDITKQRIEAEKALNGLKENGEMYSLRVQAGEKRAIDLIREQKTATLGLLNLRSAEIAATLEKLAHAEQTASVEEQVSKLLDEQAEIRESIPLQEELFRLKEILQIEEDRTRELQRQREIQQIKAEEQAEYFRTLSLRSQGEAQVESIFGAGIPAGAEGAITGGMSDYLSRTREYNDAQLSINENIANRIHLLDMERINLEALTAGSEAYLAKQGQIWELESQIDELKKQGDFMDQYKDSAKVGFMLDGLSASFGGLAEASSRLYGEGSKQAKAFATISVMVNAASAIMNTINAWMGWSSKGLVPPPVAFALGGVQVGMISAMAAAQIAQISSTSDRYHTGGEVTTLGPREVPIIAEVGEVILSRQQVAAFAGAGGGHSRSQPVNIALFDDRESLNEWAESRDGRVSIMRASRGQSQGVRYADSRR